MENPDGVQSRIFIIVAIGLVGLLMIGLLSIAGLVVYTRFLAPAASPTTVAVTSPSPTSVELATPTLPQVPVASPSPEGGATATLVVQPAGSPTRVVAAATATPTAGEEIPDTGFGPLEAVVIGVILLVIILFIRRLRFTGQT